MGRAILERRLQAPLPPTLSQPQIQLDQVQSQFAQSLSDPSVLPAAMVGSFTYRFLKLGFLGSAVSLGISRWMPRVLLTPAIALGALGGEVTLFRATHRFLSSESGASAAAFHSETWAGTFSNFFFLKAFARLGASNPLLAHTLQAHALVLGHEVSARFGFAEFQSGSYLEKLTQAAALNLSLSAGMALMHVGTGARLQIAERGLEARSHAFTLRAIGQPQASLSMASEGEPLVPAAMADFFAQGNSYSEVVTRNTSTHREAVNAALQAFESWIRAQDVSRPIRLLDLACGEAPVLPNELARRFPDLIFDYEGIDISPLQIKRAQHVFKFPGNVRTSQFTLADAWDLRHWAEGSHDVVFTGLNLHHGTPEELAFAFDGVRRVLKPGGLLLIHDEFRPAEWEGQRLSYLRRPDLFEGKSLKMVKDELLSEQQRRRGQIVSLSGEESADWRIEFVRRYGLNMTAAGISDSAQAFVEQHILSNDYPVSLPEMLALMRQSGFRARGAYFSGQHPVGDYFGFIEATH